MENSGIYQIVNKITNECYVGSSINLKKRKNDHFYLLRKKKHYNNFLQNSFNKHGENNFEFNIISLCDKTLCIKMEQHFINEIKPLFNINPTAGNSLGVKHTQETIEKIRQSQTGKKKSEETKRKIGDKNKINSKNRQPKNLTEQEKENFRNNTGFIKRRKKILQLSLDDLPLKEWDSLNEIMRQTKFHAINISRVCNKKRKTAYGFKWVFS